MNTGNKIKALRDRTNTYIKTPVRGEEPVFVVTGRKEDVAIAKREILTLADHFGQCRLAKSNSSRRRSIPPVDRSSSPPRLLASKGCDPHQQVTVGVRVPADVVGLVIGPKGVTVTRIQQDMDTYIVTPARNKDPVFEISGSQEKVKRAIISIEECVQRKVCIVSMNTVPGRGLEDAPMASKIPSFKSTHITPDVINFKNNHQTNSPMNCLTGYINHVTGNINHFHENRSLKYSPSSSFAADKQFGLQNWMEQDALSYDYYAKLLLLQWQTELGRASGNWTGSDGDAFKYLCNSTFEWPDLIQDQDNFGRTFHPNLLDSSISNQTPNLANRSGSYNHNNGQPIGSQNHRTDFGIGNDLLSSSDWIQSFKDPQSMLFSSVGKAEFLAFEHSSGTHPHARDPNANSRSPSSSSDESIGSSG